MIGNNTSRSGTVSNSRVSIINHGLVIKCSSGSHFLEQRHVWRVILQRTQHDGPQKNRAYGGTGILRIKRGVLVWCYKHKKRAQLKGNIYIKDCLMTINIITTKARIVIHYWSVNNTTFGESSTKDTDFNNKCEEMCQFFKKRGYPDSAVTTGKHHAQEIDRETALQTSHNEETIHPYVPSTKPCNKKYYSKSSTMIPKLNTYFL